MLHKTFMADGYFNEVLAWSDSAVGSGRDDLACLNLPENKACHTKCRRQCVLPFVDHSTHTHTHKTYGCKASSRMHNTCTCTHTQHIAHTLAIHALWQAYCCMPSAGWKSSISWRHATLRTPDPHTIPLHRTCNRETCSGLPWETSPWGSASVEPTTTL